MKLRNKESLALIALVIVGVFFYQLTNKERQASSQEKAADFTLSDLASKEQSLSQYEGKGVVVNFWATYCPPCKREMPAIERAYADYKNQGVEVLAVNIEEPLRIVKPFIEKQQTTFPVLLDRHGKAAKDYRVINLPVTFFISADGKIVEQVSGEMTEEIIRTNIEKIKPI